MTRYADPERCPDCQSPMPFGATRCPSCGLSLEGELAAQLFATLSHADDLLIFTGNTHVQAVRLRCGDYERLERPLRLAVALQ